MKNFAFNFLIYQARPWNYIVFHSCVFVKNKKKLSFSQDYCSTSQKWVSYICLSKYILFCRSDTLLSGNLKLCLVQRELVFSEEINLRIQFFNIIIINLVDLEGFLFIYARGTETDIDWLKPILKLKENQPGNNFAMPRSTLIFIKL